MFKSLAVSKKLLVLSLLSLGANATLPDEIDYQSSLNRYTQLKSQNEAIKLKVESLLTIVEELKAKLSANKEQELTLKNDVNKTEDSLARLGTLIEQLEDQISTLNSQRAQTSAELKNLGQQLALSQVNLKRTSAAVKSQSDLDQSLRLKLDKVDKDASGNTLILARTQAELTQVKKEVVIVGEKIQKANDELSMRKLQLPYFDNEIKKKNNELIKAQRALTEVTPRLSKLEKELSAKNEVVAHAQEEFDEIQVVVSELEKDILPLVWKRNKIQGNLDASIREVERTQEGLENANIEFQEAKLKIEPLKSQKYELTKVKLDLVTNARQLQGDLAVVEKRIKELTKEDTTAEIEELLARKAQLLEKIALNQKLQEDNERELVEVSAELSDAQGVISLSNSKISSLKKKLALAESSVKGHEQKLILVESQISRRSPKLGSLNQALKAKKETLDSAKQLQASAAKELSEVTKFLKDLNYKVEISQQEILKFNEQKKSTQAQVTALTKEVAMLTQTLKMFEADIIKTGGVVESLKGRAIGLAKEKDQLLKKIHEVEINLKDLIVQESNLKKESEGINKRKVLEEEDLNDMTLNLDSLKSELALEKNSYNIAKRDNEKSQSMLALLEKESQILNQTKAIKDLELTKAQILASDLEIRTNNNLKDYQGRLKLYEHYEGEAKTLAQTQAKETGEKAAILAGHKQAVVDASKFGNINGREIGKLENYLAAYFKGLELGHEAGIADGQKSSGDYDKGHVKGLEDGAKKATDYPQTQPFQKGHQAAKDELMALMPTNQLTLSNSINGELFISETYSFVESTQFFNEYSEFPAIAVAADDEETRVKAQISTLKNDKQITKALPEFTYTAPTKIDMKDDIKACLGVYKEVVELQKICEASFVDLYKTHFSQSHKASYYKEYEQAFNSARDTAIAQDLKDYEVERVKGEKRGYDLAYAKALIEGQEQAYEAGYNEGHRIGYDDYLANHYDDILILGREAAQRLFEQQSVVRLNPNLGPQVTSEFNNGLAQNTKFNLGLALVNYGQVASDRGAISAKIISKSSNVVVEEELVNLRSLPKEAQVNLNDVFQARITNDAQPGEEVRMDIELTYPGDDIADSYTQTTSFVSSVVVNPQLKYALAYDKEVKDRKCYLPFVGCKYLSYEIKVQLKGLRNNIAGNYNVKLTAVKGAEYIKIKEDLIVVPAPRNGEIIQGDLSYKFKKAANDKEIQLKVEILYENELIQSGMVDILAK